MEFSPCGTGIEFILNWKGVNFVDWNNLVFLVFLVCLVYKKAYQQIRVSEGSGSAYQGIRTI